MTNIVPTGFNYQGLSVDTEAFVREATSEIKRLAQRSAQDMRDIGLKLMEVKAKLPHGRFGLWLGAEFGWSDRTARGFMRVAEVFKTENFSDLNVAPSAILLLASPSTPKKAIDDVKEQSRAGRVPYGQVKKTINESKPQPTGAPMIPPGSWYANWQEYKHRFSDTSMVTFIETGDGDTTWIALEGDAVRVAQLLNLNRHKFSMPGDAFPIREAVKLHVPDPKPAWWEAMYAAFKGNVHSYPEFDKRIDIVMAGIPFAEIGEKSAAADGQEEDAPEPVQIESARVPFAAPTPGIPAASSAPDVQFPPEGWRSMVTPVEVVQPEIGLVIEMPGGSENGSGTHEDSPPDEVLVPGIVKFPDPVELREQVLNIAGDVPNSMALIDYLKEAIEQMEMTITHFEHQMLSEEDQHNLEVIKSNWHGVGILGLRLEKLSTLPEKFAVLRANQSAAVTSKDFEKVIGDAVQLKVGHEAKDLPVMSVIAEAQAGLSAVRAVA
jgi:hypothetical protein